MFFYICSMENIILKFIGQNIKGVDTYQHNGSTWLIFTDEKKWVIELTKDGTLWYNYNFFNSIFSFFSLDVIENQHYITKWVEDTIQNGLRHTARLHQRLVKEVEDTIQNGVKNTHFSIFSNRHSVENTIQNGLKNTKVRYNWTVKNVENTIQNGVKRTCNTLIDMESIEHTIQNGIKNTKAGGYLGPITIRGKVFHQFESSNQTDNVGNVIQNGVKETKAMDEWVNAESIINKTIQNGIKQTCAQIPSIQPVVERILEKGIKEIKELPDMSGNLMGYGDYYNRQEDRTKPHTKYVNEVVSQGERLTNLLIKL